VWDGPRSSAARAATDNPLKAFSISARELRANRFRKSLDTIGLVTHMQTEQNRYM
jgi:hypothetical protein